MERIQVRWTESRYGGSNRRSVRRWGLPLGTDCVRWELNANHATSAGSQREARTGDPGQEIARPDHPPPGRILPPPAGGIRHDRRAGPEHPPRLVSRMTCRSAVVFLPCRILVASAPGSELKRVNGHCYVAVNRPSRASNEVLTASDVLSTLRPNLSRIHPGSIHSVRSSSFELFSSFELSSFPNLFGRQLSKNMFSSHASINPNRFTSHDLPGPNSPRDSDDDVHPDEDDRITANENSRITDQAVTACGHCMRTAAWRRGSTADCPCAGVGREGVRREGVRSKGVRRAGSIFSLGTRKSRGQPGSRSPSGGTSENVPQ